MTSPGSARTRHHFVRTLERPAIRQASVVRFVGRTSGHQGNSSTPKRGNLRLWRAQEGVGCGEDRSPEAGAQVRILPGARS
jgi:hypothetical protein